MLINNGIPTAKKKNISRKFGNTLHLGYYSCQLPVVENCASNLGPTIFIKKQNHLVIKFSFQLQIP